MVVNVYNFSIQEAKEDSSTVQVSTLKYISEQTSEQKGLFEHHFVDSVYILLVLLLWA